MSEVWNAYLDPHPFSFDLVRDNPTTFLMRCVQHEQFPIQLPALFGEWLFNLRSALDHLLWATAAHSTGRVPPPNEDGLQYPIYDTADSWKRNLWRLKPLHQHHVEILLNMQPFNSDLDANFLGWINRLARIDRHRRMNSWTARVAVAEPVLAVPSGAMPQLEWGSRVFVGGQCDFARATFASPAAAEGVTYNPRVGIDPEISEWGQSSFWSKIRFSERLNMISLFVAGEIDVYDYCCTGNLEARDMLTDTFATEADQHRASGLFPPLVVEEDAPPSWTPATGRRSTLEKFEGRDFTPNGTHLVD